MMKANKIMNRFFCIVFLLGFTSACSQTGDLGRVHQAPASFFDRPFGLQAKSDFSIIEGDEEKQMRNVTQRFVSTIDGRSWLTSIRNIVRRIEGGKPLESDYYLWLRSQPFSSDAGRYNALLGEVELDSITLPNVFTAICAVQEKDRRRSIAAEAIVQTDLETLNALSERRRANNENTAKFTAILGFRYDSYSYALEHLLVESPHELARQVDDKLNILAVQVQVAEANQFCSYT